MGEAFYSKVWTETQAPFYQWFADGTLNVSFNCLDRHLGTQPDKVALIAEADDGSAEYITYQTLYERVCLFANGLKSLGVVAGDRVIIYMPWWPMLWLPCKHARD